MRPFDACIAMGTTLLLGSCVLKDPFHAVEDPGLASGGTGQAGNTVGSFEPRGGFAGSSSGELSGAGGKLSSTGGELSGAGSRSIGTAGALTGGANASSTTRGGSLGSGGASSSSEVLSSGASGSHGGDGSGGVGLGTSGSSNHSTTPGGSAGATSSIAPSLVQDLDLLLHLDESSWNGTPSEVRDASGVGNHGVAASGASTTSSPAKFGRAGSFDGTGYLSIGDNATLRPAGAFTVAAWIYPTELDGSAAPGIVAKRWAFGNGAAFALFIWSEQRVYADVDGDDEAHRFRSNATLTINHWYHVALVFDGSLATAERARLYIDGQLDIAHSIASSSISSFDSPLEVGRLRDGGQNFVGSIDEVAYWNRALSAAEVAALYAATSAIP